MVLLNIHTHLAQSKLEVQNVVFGREEIGHTPFSIGVHPWYLPLYTEATKTALKDWVLSKECVLIGECGLDSTSQSSLKDQEEWFTYQIELSETVHKPLILHVVKQHERVLSIHRKTKASQAWIIHGFNKKSSVADQCFKAGVYLSFGGALLQSQSLQAIFKTAPLQQVFLETDEADIAIEEVYEKAAEIKGIDVLSLAEKIEENWKKIHLKR